MTELICIICPRGCHLKIDEKNNVIGNSCKRGELYGISEVTHPTRMVTSTVVIKYGEICRLPVRTDNPVSKNMIFEVMEEINKVEVNAPIKIGDIIINNILNTGVNIIACRNVNKK